MDDQGLAGSPPRMAAMVVVSSPAAPLMLVNSPPAVHAYIVLSVRQTVRYLPAQFVCRGLLSLEQLR